MCVNKRNDMPSHATTYFGDYNVGDFFYGTNHPMKPLRLKMLQDLVWAYGLQNFLNFRYPTKILRANFTKFHSADFFEKIDEKTNPVTDKYYKKFDHFFPKKIYDDCPIFTGLTEYCERYTGASVSAAKELCKSNVQYAINWSGGLHHGKADYASGFCYTNDIVLAILELLRVFEKVLYIDIDVHHGDGVEEAFYLSDKVFTISFHHYHNSFFPGTGALSDTGFAAGKNFSANIPLKKGLSDESFHYIFIPIVTKIITQFNPKAIVLQSGADSLSGDKLGVFNLSLIGHGKCIDILRQTGIPLLILGGGGYTPANVARCWTYETSLLIQKQLDFNIPYNNYWEKYLPSNKLLFSIFDSRDKNSKKELKKLKKKILSNIKYLNLIQT